MPSGGGSSGGSSSLLGPFNIAFDTAGLGDPHGARITLIPAGTLVKFIYIVLSEAFDLAGGYHLRTDLFIADFSDSFNVLESDVGNVNNGFLSSPTKALFCATDWTGTLAPLVKPGLALVPCDLRIQDITGGASQGACQIYVDAVTAP